MSPDDKPTFVPMSDLEIEEWIELITRPPPNTPEELVAAVRERINEVRTARGKAITDLARTRGARYPRGGRFFK